MFNFDYITKEYIKEHNPNWPAIPDHPYRILIVGCSGSWKTNALLNLINHEPDVDKIYLYAKGPYKAKKKKRKSTGLKYFNDSKAFIKYSTDTNDIYKNIFKIIIQKKTIKCSSYFYQTILFHCSKIVGLISAHYFLMKIPNKRELQ